MDSKKQAQGIASLGRYGDTTLMHMRPDEVEQLTALSRANGGDITINPKTGMPEAFLGNFVSSLLPTAAGIGAGALFGPAGGAIAGGLTSYMQGKRDPLSIGLGALGGYGGANIAQSLQASAPAAVTPSAAAGSTIGATGGTTAGTNALMDTTIGGANLTNAGLAPAGGGVTATTGFNPALSSPKFGAVDPRVAGAGQIGPNYSNRFPIEGGGPFDTAQQVVPQGPNFNNINTVGAADSYAMKSGAFEEGLTMGQKAARSFDRLGQGTKQVFTDSGAREEFFQRMGGAKFDDAGNMIKEGSPTMGMVKTALPIAGAGLEAYQKGIEYPTYGSSTAGKYDPTRVLNLGMDTGLRLLAKGGKVAFEEGGVVRDRSYYGIEPQYNTTGATYSPIMGVQGGTQTRVPVQGFVDVGGKFVANPKGTMTDIDYENRFKYVTEGVAKPGDQSGGDFESKAGIQGGAGGVNPAVALNVAQGYAESQQSGLDEQGLGTLKTGGSVKRYQQGGQTTAEMNTTKAATPPPVTTMDMLIAKKNEEEMASQGIPAGINIEAVKAQAANAGMAEGGIAELTPDDGKMLNGEGDGVSDDIPATIEGEQPAALSDGEFIVPARIVSELGNGSSDAGAEKLYAMIDRIQAARKQTMGNDKQYAKDTNAERFLPV